MGVEQLTGCGFDSGVDWHHESVCVWSGVKSLEALWSLMRDNMEAPESFLCVYSWLILQRWEHTDSQAEDTHTHTHTHTDVTEERHVVIREESIQWVISDQTRVCVCVCVCVCRDDWDTETQKWIEEWIYVRCFRVTHMETQRITHNSG